MRALKSRSGVTHAEFSDFAPAQENLRDATRM